MMKDVRIGAGTGISAGASSRATPCLGGVVAEIPARLPDKFYEE